jgi:hypothetical protein
MTPERRALLTQRQSSFREFEPERLPAPRPRELMLLLAKVEDGLKSAFGGGASAPGTLPALDLQSVAAGVSAATRRVAVPANTARSFYVSAGGGCRSACETNAMTNAA